jgi:uncharacterized phiE125 gp8 family phage protein
MPEPTPPYRVAGAFKRTTTATGLIMTLAQAKAQARVDIEDDDTLINRKVGQAKEFVERVLRRELLTSKYELVLDEFPSNWRRSDYWDKDEAIRPPRPPLSSVTSITYITATGAVATCATTVYGVDTHSEPGRIYLKYGQVWPTTQARANAVTVTYECGYGDTATSVPGHILAAVELYVAHIYDSREAVAVSVGGNILELPLGFKDLVWSERVLEL